MEKKPYIPYGYEWEAEMMKLPKKELINMVREIKTGHKNIDSLLEARIYSLTKQV